MKNIYYIFILSIFILTIINLNMSMAQNIVSNPGFESGKPGELPKDWDEQRENGAEGTVAVSNKAKHLGRQSLFIEHTNDLGYIHTNKSVNIEAGDYTFRFWAMSDADSINFVSQIYRTSDWSTLLDESGNLKKGIWKKFEFPFSTLEAFSGSIQIGLTEKGHFWLDDVELVKKKDSGKQESVKVWDTITAFTNQINLQNRTFWESVPEGKDPLIPQGDIVLENSFLIMVFHSYSGKMVIYSKPEKKRAEVIPLQLKGSTSKIGPCELLSNNSNEAYVKASFSSKGSKDVLPVVVKFTRKQIIEINPAESVKGISIKSDLDYALVPNFVSDDLIFSPGDYPDSKSLSLPSDTLLMGLLRGKDGILFMTWPEGSQELKLNIASITDKKTTTRNLESIDFYNDGKTFYLAFIDSPGIWHREVLKPEYLEKSIQLTTWKRPFPAKWVTQLYEDDLKTRYTFKESESKVGGFWRAGIGFHTYPVWFKGELPFMHLSKKIPPKGDSIIYFVERRGTPANILTPVDIIQQTLDKQTYESIIDSEGRKRRSLTRPNCAVGTATCEVTDNLKLVFQAGQEVEKKDYVAGGAEDMVYFLTEERKRAEEYQIFAREMIEFLNTKKEEKPELKDFLDKMESIAKELIDAYTNEKENIKELDYARELANRTVALTESKNENNLLAFILLKNEWTGMGGAIDDLNRKLHTTTRKLFQEAAYSSATQPEAVKVAEEIRKRTLKCLRNPGSYEIWADY